MNKNNSHQPSHWQLLILALSIYLLAALFVETVFRLPSSVSRIIHISDTTICLLFIADFFARLFRAKDKLEFLKWGWIDARNQLAFGHLGIEIHG